MKKIGLILSLAVVLAIMLQLSSVLALDLTISKREISAIAVIELNKPAIFELTITNNEPGDETLTMYTNTGVTIKPSESFTIDGNSTSTLNLEVYPRKVPGYFSFEYKIKNQDNEIQVDNLAINNALLKDAFNIKVDDIVPNAENAVVHFGNKGGLSYDNILADFSSIFFKDTKTFSLGPNENKQFEIPIDQEKIKSILAGPYLLTTSLEVEGEKTTADTLFTFTEKAGVSTKEIEEGFFLRRQEITKTNNGNTEASAEIIIKKNLLSAIITTFNIAPTNEDYVGFKKYYIFQTNLKPSQELKVIVKTNWWILIIVIVGLLVGAYLAIKYSAMKLRLVKKVTFVKTKGGEFALKISVIAKAKEFVEKIKITDKIPTIVKIYERFGSVAPDRVDEKNRRIEWDVESMSKGEERVFSYVIYSKIGVFGRFELPEADAIYNFRGQLKRATSNRAFYINEPNAKNPVVRKIEKVA